MPANGRWDLTWCLKGYKTDSSIWSGNMDDDEEGRTSSANFCKENI